MAQGIGRAVGEEYRWAQGIGRTVGEEYRWAQGIGRGSNCTYS